MQPWILAGYELFADDGPQGLKVEVISRKVNRHFIITLLI